MNNYYYSKEIDVLFFFFSIYILGLNIILNSKIRNINILFYIIYFNNNKNLTN